MSDAVHGGGLAAVIDKMITLPGEIKIYTAGVN